MVPFETFFLSWSLQSERTLAACVDMKYMCIYDSSELVYVPLFVDLLYVRNNAMCSV